jgi:hypothetical protein
MGGTPDFGASIRPRDARERQNQGSSGAPQRVEKTPSHIQPRLFCFTTRFVYLST